MAEETSLSPDELETEVTRSRDRLGSLLEELSRRRHDAVDIRLQLRRHALPLLLAAGAVALAVAGGIALAVRRRRHKRSLRARAHRLRLALSRMMAHPERVAGGEPHAGLKILTSAASAAATALAKSAVSGSVRRT